MSKFNKQNLENLKELRNDIYMLMLQGKITQESFDMGDYWLEKTCGSVGCLIGWSCSLYKPVNDFMYKHHAIERYGFHDGSTITGEFLFTSKWDKYDNTPEGALARMDVIINEPNLFGEYLEEDEPIANNEEF